MQCSKCKRPAIIFQRYSGLHLCRNHFLADFEAKAKRAIRTHRWLEPGDSIAVALSGGKDSSSLLHFLKGLLSRRRDVRLLAITIDEGISGYRNPAVARKIAEALGVEHHTFTFHEEFGITVDEIVRIKGDSLSCSYCGVLRRQCLNRAARSLGITRLAMGLNLDDEAQSVLMNTLRGDARRLVRKKIPREGLVQRIKPFLYIPEREVALYAYLQIEDFDSAGCPYSHNALRADVRNILNDYAWRHPSTRYSLVNLGEELASYGALQGGESHFCPECGEPCGETCRSCQMRAEVDRNEG
ncbi:MAG TPA: TIGR00269 family protein [Methanoregulaceae archaeon]|nr:TIGR00269 family protein [Methanoregulaceae archaeon]